MSADIKIVELARPVLNNPILIQGLPGLGFVGKIAVDFLIDQLKPIKFAEFYSPYIALPDGDIGVKVELDSTFTLPKYEFYAYGEKPHLILLTGDAQPAPLGQYNVAKRVLDFIEDFECRTLVALGGYAFQRRNVDVIYAVASDSRMVNDLKKKFNIRLAQSGMIKGAFGVMLGLGRDRNLECIGLLGATVGTFPDLRASRNVIRLVAKMFNLPINWNEIDKRIEALESRMNHFEGIRFPIRPREEKRVPHGYIS